MRRSSRKASLRAVVRSRWRARSVVCAGLEMQSVMPPPASAATRCPAAVPRPARPGRAPLAARTAPARQPSPPPPRRPAKARARIEHQRRLIRKRQPSRGPARPTQSKDVMLRRHGRHQRPPPAAAGVASRPPADGNVTGRPGRNAARASLSPCTTTAGGKNMLDVQARGGLKLKPHKARPGSRQPMSDDPTDDADRLEQALERIAALAARRQWPRRRSRSPPKRPRSPPGSIS